MPTRIIGTEDSGQEYDPVSDLWLDYFTHSPHNIPFGLLPQEFAFKMIDNYIYNNNLGFYLERFKLEKMMKLFLKDMSNLPTNRQERFNQFMKQRFLNTALLIEDLKNLLKS